MQAAREPLLGNNQSSQESGGLLGWLKGIFSTRGNVIPGGNIKIEPKTFFANERTLLSWMNVAVLLATLSLTLMNFGMASSRIAGLILAPVSIFFIVYSFLVYVRRNNSLVNKEPIEYNNMVGPTVLVFVLVIALSTIIILNVLYGGELSVSHKAAAEI